MAKRLNNTLYYCEIIAYVDRKLCYVQNEERYLFSGRYKTKILPSDLPEWYLYGRYYKSWGYMSTKGIVDLVYHPNMHTNHFLKDDFLYISYKDKIEPVTDEERKIKEYRYSRYKGYDQLVCGSEIIDILKGAKKYSNYDIAPIIEKLKEKEKWLRETYPEHFGCDNWKYDIEEDFKSDISKQITER